MKISALDSITIGSCHYVRITTDDGTTGLGQSGVWAYPEAADAVVTRFKDYLIGQDPRRIEHHWQHLYRMGPFRGSILSGAISAVDIALWDIKGKQLDAPIWQLLGGYCRDRVRLMRLIDGPDPASALKNSRAAAEEGYTAVKLDPLPDGYQDMTIPRLVESVVETVAAAREGAGLDVDVVIELHRKLTPLQFPTLAAAIAEFRPLFIEDPIQIDSIMSQAEMARRVQSPTGTGERLHTIWEFRELLSQGGAQFCRPDVGLGGGITHCKKIAAVAESFHAALLTHNFLGPVLTAATVHLDVAIPNFVVQEYYPLAEEGPFSKAFKTSLRREGGFLLLPEAPGLGVEFDEAIAEPLWADPHGWMRTPLRRDGSVALAV